MSQDFIPSREDKFLDWAKNLVDYAIAHITDFGLDLKSLKALRSLVTAYGKAYMAAAAPTRNRVDICAKREAKEKLQKAIRSYVRQHLAYNDKVSDKDREAMGIPVHDRKPTPIPRPSTLVEPTIKIGLRQLTISFRDQGSSRKAKPAGYHAAEIRWAVLDKQPGSVLELNNSITITRTPCVLTFDEADRKKTVFFCLCWQNAKGWEGPWGEIFSATVA